jgi:hypothetical protein
MIGAGSDGGGAVLENSKEMLKPNIGGNHLGYCTFIYTFDLSKLAPRSTRAKFQT